MQNALGILLVRPGPDGRISGEEAQRAAPHFQRAVAADPCHPVAALNLIECLTGLEGIDLATQGPPAVAGSTPGTGRRQGSARNP